MLTLRICSPSREQRRTRHVVLIIVLAILGAGFADTQVAAQSESLPRDGIFPGGGYHPGGGDHPGFRGGFHQGGAGNHPGFHGDDYQPGGLLLPGHGGAGNSGIVLHEDYKPPK
jgi:hypothetical protein